MTNAQLKELVLHAAKGTAPANFSVSNVDAAVADGLRALCNSVNNFMRNRYDVYEMIIEAVDEVVPQNVIAAISPFAEVVSVPQGQKAIFKLRNKLGRERAKQFLTQVGLSGVYETFRLDVGSFEVGAHAVGGAARLDFERFLDGSDTMAELMEIVTEGLENAVYVEVHKALVNAINTLQGPMKVVVENHDPAELQALIGKVKSYGRGAAIFATPEFIEGMGADAIVPATANAQAIYHPDDIDAIHKTGRIKIFRGTPVIELPQSHTDDTHTTTYLPTSVAYVFPTGGQKLVKVVLEGNTQIYDAVNRDQSVEINVYKKMGAAVMSSSDWGVYINEAIEETYAEYDKETNTFGQAPSFGYGF